MVLYQGSLQVVQVITDAATRFSMKLTSGTAVPCLSFESLLLVKMV